MTPLAAAFAFITDGSNWSGPDGLATRLIEHVQITLVATAAAALVALPPAFLIGHTRRGEPVATTIASLGRALPSFGVLAIVFPFTLRYLPGIGYWPTLIALFLLAIPPILTNTYVGVQNADRSSIEAARGMGMTELQILKGVELPPAMPFMIAGIRTSVVQVLATATLGAVVGWGGLGRLIVDGFARRDPALTLTGAFLVAALAIAAELLFGAVGRWTSQDRSVASHKRGVASAP